MPRSHPPALTRTVERTLRSECRVEPGTHVLVAVSGGADSTALLHALSLLARRMRLHLHAHGVDHGLRPEAAAELDCIESQAVRWDVPFSRTALRVPPGPNLQARAREVRYAALRAAARKAGAELVATAHHADDRAETVLIRMLRGAPPEGLAVLPPRSGDLIRPLIRARKVDVVAHLARHQLAFAEDPSNADPRFIRARVRHEALPLLESIAPGVAGHLNALADALAEGPPPVVRDEAGSPVRLRRAQAAALRRALRSPGHGGRVRLSGGRDVVVEPRTGNLDLVVSTPARRLRAERLDGPGAAGPKPTASQASRDGGPSGVTTAERDADTAKQRDAKTAKRD